MKSSVYEGKNVTVNYLNTQATPALEGLDMTIEAGECVLLTGISGSGKSTLTQVINGLIPHYLPAVVSGESYTLGYATTETPIETYVGEVGSVFQNPKSQHFATTVRSELAFPLENIGTDVEEIEQQVAFVAERFHLTSLLERSIFDLSGGEKQRLAIATATILKPSVYVFDEITANLDEESVQQIYEMLRQLKADGATIILAEHRLAWVMPLVDRVFTLEAGKLTHQLSPQELWNLSREKRQSFGLRTLQQKNILDHLLVNQVDNEEDIVTKRLSIGYGDHHKKKSYLNLRFPRYGITALTGANGQGKTTLVKTLVGLLPERGGTIEINHQVISTRERLDNAFLVMQDVNYQLVSDSVWNEVRLGAKYPQKAEEILDWLNLSTVKHRHPASLSGGQKQRVMIASAILSGKKWLIFDEPTSGLDYYHMTQFGQLLDYLAKKGFRLLVVTHDVEFINTWCDHVVQI